MASQAPPEVSENAQDLHRRESWWQIYLPFLAGTTFLFGLAWIVGLPNSPDWQARAQAIASLSYSLLCLFPILLCLFFPYLILVLGIAGMVVLHRSTEKPLRTVEKAAASLVQNINHFSENIDEKAEAFDAALAPAYKLFSIFDKPREESHESAEENSI
jgi:hypothetical protein